MAYAGIERKRFAQLLELGTDDDELRRFFAEARVQLIQKGAKVQNLPHGKSNRIRMLTQGLSSATDKIVQKWFSENLTMFDPEPIAEAVNHLRLYDEVGESPPEDEARRLSRTCLVHLFSTAPPAELMAFLKPAKAEPPPEPSEGPEDASSPSKWPDIGLSAPLVGALVALEEGQDPDERLSALPSEMAALISGLYAIRTGNESDVQSALSGLEVNSEAHRLLSEYALRRANARARAAEMPTGLQLVRPAEADDATPFDLDRDVVLAVCVKDTPDTQVFLQPLAVHVGTSWLSLAQADVREKMFWTSGNLMAFAGRHYPKQPRRWEFGIWHVAKNEYAKATDRTNFHIRSEKTPVYEVRTVPFASTDYDGVREFIKHHAGISGPDAVRATLFVLRDDLVVGCPQGRDLSQDDGFEAGLPCWRALQSFRFEGRLLVPGPLPPADTYECDSLASSLRKLVAADKTSSDKLTRAQTRRLLELVASGEVRLSVARADRLRAELQLIDEHEGAKDVLLDAAMSQPKIAEEVSRRVQERVDELTEQREDLRKSIEEQKQLLASLSQDRKRAEKEQRALAPAIAKAIRGAFDKAQRESIETLGQVAVFKALIDQTSERPATTPPASGEGAMVRTEHARIEAWRRPRVNAGASAADVLQSLGITPKWVAALQTVGQLAHDSGLVLLVDGLVARLAAEGWLADATDSGAIVDCRIGLTDDHLISDLLSGEVRGVAILDANLSPPDVYARPLLDAVQRRIAGSNGQRMDARIVMSLSGSLAALPIPPVLESISLRVGLDRAPEFMGDADAHDKLHEFAGADSSVGWLARLWRPAAVRVLTRLREMPIEHAALAMSALRECNPDQ